MAINSLYSFLSTFMPFNQFINLVTMAMNTLINSYTQHLCEVQIYILLVHFTCVHDGG